ncbi:MAG: ABC transporter permease [Anaerolineales bacterium]|nr:ABC transporter permease [Anaerolineales bacterium]
MRRFLVLTKAILLVHLRERAQLFWNFAFPVFLLVIYAAVFGGDDLASFIAWMVPGIIATNILAFGLISSSTLITEMRTKGVLRRLQASPVPTAHLLGAYLLVNVLSCLLQLALIIVVATLFYGLRVPPANLALAAPWVVVAVLVAVVIGQAVSSVVGSAGAAVVIGQVLYFGQMFITDLIMPIQYMPAWVQRVGPWLPGYAIAQLVRPPLQEGVLSPELGTSLLLAAAYTLVAGLLAARFFKWEARA